MSLIAYSDIGQYLTEDGQLKVKNFKELPPQITRCIKKVRIHKTVRKLAKESSEGSKGDQIIDQNIEFELYDKKAALDRMGQTVGIFKDSKEITGANGSALFPAATTVLFDFGTEVKPNAS